MIKANATEALRLAYTNLFLLAGRLRSGEVPAARVDTIRGAALSELQEQRRILMRADLDDQSIDDVEMAVIAIVDESAQISPNRDCAEQWLASSLQYKRYRHTNLGRDFFVRLEVLRARPDTPLALLEIYMRCLTFGFEGKYREEKRIDDLRSLRESLQAELLHRMGTPASLSSPLEAISPPPPPAPIFSGFAVFGLATALVMFVGVLLTALLTINSSSTVSSLHEIQNRTSGKSGAH